MIFKPIFVLQLNIDLSRDGGQACQNVETRRTTHTHTLIFTGMSFTI